MQQNHAASHPSSGPLAAWTQKHGTAGTLHAAARPIELHISSRWSRGVSAPCTPIRIAIGGLLKETQRKHVLTAETRCDGRQERRRAHGRVMAYGARSSLLAMVMALALVNRAVAGGVSRGPAAYTPAAMHPMRLRGGAEVSMDTSAEPKGLAHLAAYMLCRMGKQQSGDETDPTVEDVKKTLESVGAAVEDDTIATIVKDLNGKSLEDIDGMISEGKQQYEAMNAEYNSVMAKATGGGGGGGNAAEGQDKPAAADKTEEKKNEASEASDLGMGSGDDMGFGLFD